MVLWLITLCYRVIPLSGKRNILMQELFPLIGHIVEVLTHNQFLVTIDADGFVFFLLSANTFQPFHLNIKDYSACMCDLA